jgi:hypothetical protein
MIQQSQVFKLKAKGADGQPLWAYRYRIEGRGSERRIDTDDIVHLICEHLSSLQPSVGGQPGVGLGWKPRAARL